MNESNVNFSGIYAQSYDHIYKILDPEKELAQVEEFCGEFIQNPKKVLDIGGGTGRIAKILAGKYQEVYMVEPSFDMAKIASSKLGNTDNIKILNESAQNFKLSDLANGAYLMFSVASYFSTPMLFREAMRNIISNSAKGSYVYFDVWGSSAPSTPVIASTVKTFIHNDNSYERLVNVKPNSIHELEPGFHSVEMHVTFKNITTGINYEEIHKIAIISENWLKNTLEQETRINSMRVRFNPSKLDNIEVCFSLN
jgi:ubiquinone/menaquinone biosynthesis C-methylase UbiE